MHFAALCLLLASGAISAQAWGTKGHIAVANIAVSFLSEKAVDTITQSLQAANIESIEVCSSSYYYYYQSNKVADMAQDASTWPDRIRRSRPTTASYHYGGSNSDMPPSKCTFAFPLDCTNSKCVVTGITNSMAVLLMPDADDVARGEAIAFLIHYVGDLHQPLHATNYLKGGNGTPAHFGRAKANLHSVWDSKLLEKTIKESYAGDLQDYTHAMTSALSGKWRQQTPAWTGCARDSEPGSKSMSTCIVGWMRESNSLVCEKVYNNFEEGMDTSEEYWKDTRDVVDMQIARAGIRLGVLLNKVFH